jgi:hypothetical protein
MKQYILLPILALFMTALFSTPVLAAPVKCKVVSVEGTTVVFDCGKKAKKLQTGTAVTVTGKKKDGGGC